MSKNVVVLFSVNGVGKSVVAKAASSLISGSVCLSGSMILRQAFGGISREDCERLSPEEKMAVMVPAFVQNFSRWSTAPLVFLDTHLVVPIRHGNALVLENVWSDTYLQFIRMAVFLYAAPKEVRHRRLLDQAIQGRVRNTDLNNIHHDQRINREAFQRYIVPFVSETDFMKNRDGDLLRTVQKLVSWC